MNETGKETPNNMTAFVVSCLVALVLVTLLLVANPRIRCQVTFGTWVKASAGTLIEDNPDDNYTPSVFETPAHCEY